MTFDNRCVRVYLDSNGATSNCDVSSVLQLFTIEDDSQMITDEITRVPDVLDHINQAVENATRNAIGKSLKSSDIFGRIVFDEAGNIDSINTFAMLFSLVNLERRENGDKIDDSSRVSWEVAASKKIRANAPAGYSAFVLLPGDTTESFSDALQGDLLLLPVCFEVKFGKK